MSEIQPVLFGVEDPHDWRWIEVAFGAFGWFCPHCGGMEGPRPANARTVGLQKGETPPAEPGSTADGASRADRTCPDE